MLGLLLQELCTDFDDSPGDKDDRSMDRRVFRRLFGQMCRNNASSRSAATVIVALSPILPILVDLSKVGLDLF